MTLLSRLLSFFPAFHLGTILASLLSLVRDPSLGRVLLVPVAIYLLPVFCYRLHERFFPLQEGLSYLAGRRYSPWWGGHQMQLVFLAFPALETALRLVPGLFSAWLRLWGSEVGQGVYWTPRLELLDRALVEVGDGAIFGHRVGIYPHIIRPREGDLLLLVKRVRIGRGAFVGAGSHLGPGVSLADGVTLPVDSKLFPNQKVES